MRNANRRLWVGDTRRVLGVAGVFFGGLAALAAARGVFARLGDSGWWVGGFALAALALVALLDEEVRAAFMRRRPAAQARGTAGIVPGLPRKAPAPSPAAKLSSP